MTVGTRQQPLKIGLTGGIASGKSTVATMFAELGIAVVDTDIIARELVAPGEPALAAIRQRFGERLVDASGHLDRAALRKRIFADEQARLDLEAILHPRIGDETRRQAQAAPGPYVVIVVPLLVGSPLARYVDRIVVVDCDEELQLQRLLARDAESVEQARRILATQASREARLAIADYVISNDQGLLETRQQVHDLDAHLRRRSGRS